MHSQEEVKQEIRQALEYLQHYHDATDATVRDALFRELAGIQIKLASWVPNSRVDGPIGFHAMFGLWVNGADPEKRLDSITRTIYLMQFQG